MASSIGPVGGFDEQSRLADPCGAYDLDGTRTAGCQGVEGVIDPPKLLLAAYEAVSDREDESADDLRVLP